ncbi:MAG: hypothetical protein MUF58_22260 [Arcicella sp.]|jgi:hypothetical protein|nr:hypothetical protein [Arcicella sp.]
MQFDENGFLQPYEIIQISVEDLEKIFVWNDDRKKLFDEYLDYIIFLKQFELGSFFQWIDGSFISTKIKPNDIDIVTFIEFKEHEQHYKEIAKLQHQFSSLDTYFVKVYPQNHPSAFLYELDKTEWNFQFSFSRKNPKTGKSFKKGFVQINF